MSYAIPYEEPAPPVVETSPELLFVPRSKLLWIPFLIPVGVCGLSYLCGGLPLLTDLGFLILTILCGIFLMLELARFPRRFGIGGLVLFGGVLIWYCQDYFTHWFLADFNNPVVPVSAAVVAKAAFWHMLFITMMVVGLNIQKGRWMQRLVLCIPEPGKKLYFLIMMGMFAIGICPFFLFVSEPFYLAMYHAMFSASVGGPAWTVFRTGNLNYSWGGYVAQILQVGQVGGVFAIMYAILVARRWIPRLIAVAIWVFWVMLAYQTDRRGNVAFEMLPAVGFLFIKYQAQAAALFKRFSLKSYMIAGLVAFMTLIIVQVQGSFRGVGLGKATLSGLDLTKNQGNTMFSEGLIGYSLIPDVHDFFRGSHPLEGLVRPIPDSIYDLIIGVIPRALWHDKPVDDLWAWYNSTYIGSGNGQSGTTISKGLVGTWYFNYGFCGVIEGGLLLGWLMSVSERALQHSDGKPIGILMSLGLATWIFRLYRDWIFIDLYPLLIGGVVLWILVKLASPFSRQTTYMPAS